MATPSGKGKKSVKNKTSPASGGTPSKRKKILTVTAASSAAISAEDKPDIKVEDQTIPLVIDVTQTVNSTDTLLSATVPAASVTGTEDALVTTLPDKPPAIFKDPTFVHSSKGVGGGKRTRVWKNLKQIISGDRSLPWKPTDVTYASIDAPPSFRPGKKYSDLSGLEASYIDPQTKIRYATGEEFSRVRILPGDIVTGYLALRKANTPVP